MEGFNGLAVISDNMVGGGVEFDFFTPVAPLRWLIVAL